MREQAIPEGPLSTLRISIADMIVLGVRARRPDSPDLPKLLYQSLPLDSMPLAATLPRGAFAVSIAHQSNRRGGYPIMKTPPSDAGFAVVYARKENGRYEAVSVKYQNAELEIESFIVVARQWTEEHAGRLKPYPGRYAYFAPSKEEWDVIVRDNGYIAWNPAAASSPDFCRVSSGRLPSCNGALIRIPLYTGEKLPREEILPAFSRVEVAPGSDPERQNTWLAFEEYQRARAECARFPDAAVADFLEWLVLLTQESGFERWTFGPGMLFEDRMEWWGESCPRRTAHEGLDFAEGWRSDAGTCGIPEGMPVRSIMDGDVVAILDDFIGKTVVVRHASVVQSDGGIFYTFLSHIKPEASLLGPVSKGQVLGRVGKMTKTRAPIHLHVTGAWIPAALSVKEIGLDAIHPGFAPVVLVNLNDVLWKSPLCQRGDRSNL